MVSPGASWGRTVADEGLGQALTPKDPFLEGVYRRDGVYLPGAWNDAGRGDNRSHRHTLRFNRSGTCCIAVTHDRRLDGGNFELSLHDLGTATRYCTEVDVDNLTYQPGTYDGQ